MLDVCRLTSNFIYDILRVCFENIDISATSHISFQNEIYTAYFTRIVEYDYVAKLMQAHHLITSWHENAARMSGPVVKVIYQSQMDSPNTG